MNWLDKYNIPKAQNGEDVNRYNIDVRRTNMIGYVPYFENVPTTEFDDKSVERAKREAELYNEYIEKKYGPQNEYRNAKSAEKAAERLKRLKQTVEVTPITKNKEEQEVTPITKNKEEQEETDNKEYNTTTTTSSKTTNKKQKKKKEKDDGDEGGSGYFPPPFIIDAPNYTGVKPQFYNNVNDESKGDAGIVNTDVFAPSEISYKDYMNINSANYRNAQRLAGSNLGLQLLLNNEKYKKDADILQKEANQNEYAKILTQEKNKNAINLGRSVNNMSRAKNGIEGTMGGLTDVPFNYNSAWGGQFEDGGFIPIAQKGKEVPAATRADSLAVYNNTRAIEDYYKKQGYVKERVKDSKDHKRAIKNGKEWVNATKKYLKDAKNAPVDAFYTQTDKNKNIAEQKKYLKEAQQSLSETINQVDPKNYIKKLEDSKKSFEKRPKNKGTHIDEQNNLVEGTPSVEKFYLPVDENKFYQREQSAGFLDLRSPMPLYDKRIVPQYLSELESPDLILQDQIADKMYKAQTVKERDALAKQYADLVYTDRVEMYEYEPLAVMPFDMVPPELQRERVEKYGLSGVPKSIIDAHPEWLENTNQSTKTQTLQPRVEALNLRPIEQAPINIPVKELDFNTPIKAPKSYNVNMQRYNMQGPSDYYQANEEGVDYQRAIEIKAASDAYNKYIQEKYGNEDALKNPKAVERLKQLKQNVEVTPQYQMGGSIPGAVGFTYARTNNPAPSNGSYAKKTKASAKDGEIIKDDLGQWAHPGEITEINSPYITMQGVPYPVLGISDEGDVQMMYPEEEYEFVGKKVTEFPMAKNGIRQEQKGLVNLDQLTNFTNYNTKQPGGWMDKYQ